MARQYKVLTQKDRFFGGKFDPDKIEGAVNGYATEGRERLLGRLDQLRALVKWAVAEQVEIGVVLGAGKSVPPSLSYDEVEAGAAALESVHRQQLQKPELKKKRA